MSNDLWTMRFDLEGLDITGFDVQARDGAIGTVDAMTDDVGSPYVVVDTGFWILGQKSLIPARDQGRRCRRGERLHQPVEAGNQGRA